MTLRDWIRARSPVPPPRLQTRIDEVLGARGDQDASTAATACLDAAASLLGRLCQQAETGRDSALDLLTVDALVTYAFEAAAETPDAVPSLAASATLSLAGAMPDAPPAQLQ